MIKLFRPNVAIVLVLTLLAPVGYAQDGGVSGELQRVAETSPEEKSQYVADVLAEMGEGVKEIKKHYDLAKRRGDERDSDCVKPLLSRSMALRDVIENVPAALDEANTESRPEKANSEMRKTVTAISSFRTLVIEAGACVGRSQTKSGETTRTVDGPLEADAGELEDPPFDVLDLGFDPPIASPFL